MKGNKPIRCHQGSTVVNGNIIIKLRYVLYKGKHVPLFTVVRVTKCKHCGGHLKVTKNYFRYVISSYGLLEIPVKYHYCESCSISYPDHIVGVRDGANYSDEYLEKVKYARYSGKSSLHNSSCVGETFTSETSHKGRAPCAATIWKYEQKEGKLALTELRKTKVNLGGKIYVDGIWIKTGYKGQLEKMLGRKISEREWKRLRYKVVYVAATREKVLLDFQITNQKPSPLELLPLFSRLNKRFPDRSIKTIVSDEDWAIINSAKQVFPNANQAFCVFHQLKKINELFFAIYDSKEKMSEQVKSIHSLAKQVILSKNVIESTTHLHNLKEKVREMKDVPPVVNDVYRYVKKKYHQNRKLFKKNMVPETNNTMEQIFSTFKDFIFQCRSFKLLAGLRNWIANLLFIKNKTPFKTGKNSGRSPLEINRKSRASGVG